MRMKEKSNIQDFEEVNVKRINIIENDGTIRMAISNTELFPTPKLLEDKDIPREGNPGAGIVFYNDEGIECGGLRFSSQKEDENNYEQNILLAFDPYLQNDVVDLGMYDRNGERTYALVFSDRPKKFLTEFVKEHEHMLFADNSPEKQTYMKELYEKGEIGFERMKIEKSSSGEVSVKLSDSKGRQRIRLAVDQHDNPKLEFLDEEGQVIYSLPPDK